MADFLDFQKISKEIPFEQVLDFLNIAYKVKGKEIRGEGFIVNVEKNLYFNPKGDDKGGVINFLANHRGVDLRTAGKELVAVFLSKDHEPKREIPELALVYHSYLEKLGISPETASLFEMGLYKGRGIMNGKIAVKVYGQAGEKIGYVGKNLKDDKWFFPKGFKRPVYNLPRQVKEAVILVSCPFQVARFHQMGFSFVVALLGLSMNDEQEEQLQRFKRILLLHPDPDNLIGRLSKSAFIKAPQIVHSAGELCEEEVKSFF